MRVEVSEAGQRRQVAQQPRVVRRVGRVGGVLHVDVAPSSLGGRRDGCEDHLEPLERLQPLLRLVRAQPTQEVVQGLATRLRKGGAV